jgi:hypothetical protein
MNSQEIHKRTSKNISILFFLYLLISFDIYSQVYNPKNYFPIKKENKYFLEEVDPCPPSSAVRRHGVFLSTLVKDSLIINNNKYYCMLVSRLHAPLDTVRADSNGNVILYYQGKDRVFYKFDANIGDKWNFIDTLDNSVSNYQVTLVSKNEIITTRAGRFSNCYRFYFDVPNVRDEEFTDWIAPGVGLIFRCNPGSFELYEANIGGIQYPITSVTEKKDPVRSFRLYQNYPNPFNPETIFKYELNETGKTSLIIYDILGNEVKSLVNEIQRPGVYELKWDGKNYKNQDVSSGAYVCRLLMNNYQISKSIFKIK